MIKNCYALAMIISISLRFFNLIIQQFFSLLVLLFGILIFSVKLVEAKTPSLDLPVACTPGLNCWLINFVDHDPSMGVRDFRCEDHLYNGHKGTDIAIRDLKAMYEGVPVRATAPGRVVALRDGMQDKIPTSNFRINAKNRYCGNGVVIDHYNGWETQYCHLRRGSIIVERGQDVGRGQRLGFVGHSGMAEFPHVHLSVRYRGRVIDPFVGQGQIEDCKLGKEPLWSPAALRALSVNMTAIYNVGFASVSPKLSLIREGFYRSNTLKRNSSALILWAEIFWVKPEDKVRLRIKSPAGDEILNSHIKIEKRQARRMIYSGRKNQNLLWPVGQYRGEVLIERLEHNGQVSIFTAESEVRLIN